MTRRPWATSTLRCRKWRSHKLDRPLTLWASRVGSFFLAATVPLLLNSLPAAGVTIDFTGVPGADTNAVQTNVTLSGFTFSSPHFHIIGDAGLCSFGGCVAGTPYLAVDGPQLGQPVTLSAAGGGTFSFTSFQSSQLWNDSAQAASGEFPNAAVVAVTGTEQNRTTQTESFIVGPGFQTYSLGSAFSSVSSVLFAGSGPVYDSSFAIKNLTLNQQPTPTPTPTPPTFSPQTKQIFTAISGASGGLGSALSLAGTAGLEFFSPLTTATQKTLGAAISGLNFLTTGLSLSNYFPPSSSTILIGTDAIQLMTSLITAEACGPACELPLALSVAGTALNTISNVFSIGAADPPDPNYKMIISQSPTQVSAAQLTTLGAYAQTTAILLNAAEAVRTYGLLVINDLQKLQGALNAGDATYAAIHASNLLRDNALFQTSFGQLIAALQDFKQAVESNPSNNITIDITALENLRQTIKQIGLPPELLNALQAYGFMNLLTPDQLQSVLFDTPLPTNLPSDLFTALDTEVSLLG